MAKAKPTPSFLDGSAGPLFAVSFEPETPSAEAVLFVSPFGEEMNRSRRVFSLQARRLAAEGYGSLILDLYGTGDSAGDFKDARWEIWRDDVSLVVEWLRKRGYEKVTLLGLRLGACLAVDTLGMANAGIGRLVLWQPVLNGRAFLRQLLRVRLAAGLTMGGNGSAETTDALLQRLKDGETIEVGGYPLTPSLSESIEGLELAALGARCGSLSVDWLDIGNDPTAPASAAVKRAMERWAAGGSEIRRSPVKGEPFWAIEEPPDPSPVLDATTSLWARPVGR